jgi:predicted O-linked N-acetylglucosamine transferase (SPINDLY family)
MKAAIELWAAGDRAGAVSLASQVIAKFAYHPRANELLAAAHAQDGQWEEAETRLGIALKGEPSNPELYFALACARGNRGNVAGAAEAFARALDVAPKFSRAVTPLAIALIELGRSSEAEAVLRRGLSRNPGDSEAAAALAAVLADRTQTGQGLELLRASLAANPNDHTLVAVIRQWLSYLDESGDGEARELRERYGRLLGRPSPWPLEPSRDHSDRPLRIGYISPDLKRHSVTYFFEPILAHHDRDRFETFCYRTMSAEDEVTRRLKSCAMHWRTCAGLDDASLIAAIRNDRIDILIELSGITTGNRLAALSHRAAPMQATYIGCPSSTGVAAIDVRIVDEITDPPGAETHASESLLRLPGCFLCYRPPEEAPDTVPPPCTASIGGPITFGSFNSLAKLSPTTARLWAEVLRAVPGSSLLLKGKALGDPAARAVVAQSLGNAGISPDRLHLLADIPDLREHLAAYSRIDIALDPTPYNGTTTTCEALWMGVPVVTLRGRLHAGRVGASLLSAAGFPEWIANSPERYVRIATALAQDRSRLASLRGRQRERVRASRLCDAITHTRALEAALRAAWQDRVASRA